MAQPHRGQQGPVGAPPAQRIPLHDVLARGGTRHHRRRPTVPASSSASPATWLPSRSCGGSGLRSTATSAWCSASSAPEPHRRTPAGSWPQSSGSPTRHPSPTCATAGRAGRASSPSPPPMADRASRTYEESWGRLVQTPRQLRCNLCPDGLGELADVTGGDAWHRRDEGSDGISLILARTPRGADIVAAAIRDGYLDRDRERRRSGGPRAAADPPSHAGPGASGGTAHGAAPGSPLPGIPPVLGRSTAGTAGVGRRSTWAC